MATVDEVVAAIEALPIAADGSLVLAAADLPAIPVVQSLFADVVDATSLTFAGAERTPATGTGTVSVTGDADLFGLGTVTATLTVGTADGTATAGDGPAPALGEGTTISLTATLAPTAPITLPIATWIAIEDVSVTATVTEPYQLVTFGYAASLVLEGETTGTVPITITPGAAAGQWTVTIAGSTGPAVTPAQLVALLSGISLTSFLPQVLVDALDGLALSDLIVRFDTTAKTVTEISVGITATNGWAPATGFALDPGLHLALSVSDPLDGTTREVVAVVTGTVEIDAVPVPVFVQVDVAATGTSAWLIGLDPASDGVTLPSLSGLFDLAGGPGFSSTLPPALATLPAIQIDPLMVGFTLAPAALQSVSFGATTLSPWELVPGFLAVEKITTTLELAGLDGAQKTVGGTLSAIFSITDAVWLYVQVVKDPATAAWTLSGGLPPGHPLDLTDLVATLLEGHVTLPAAAPKLVLDTAQITVVPGASMQATLGSTTPWPLLPALVLDSFTLRFGYTAGAAQPFTGSLATAMTIGGVGVDLSAGLDTSGTWSFTGSTTPGVPIPVGKMIDDLLHTWGVTAVPVGALGGFTISDVVLSFSAGSAAGSPAAFHFACHGAFAIAGSNLALALDVALTQAAAGSYTGTFTGLLTVTKGDATTEQVSVTLTGGTLTAAWTASPGHELSLTDIAGCLGFADAPIPSALDLTLSSLAFTYDVASSGLSLSATTVSGDKAALVTAMVPGGGTPVRRFAFGLDLPLGITLADLPLVGDDIPSGDQLGLADLGCWVISGDLVGSGDTSDAKALNDLIPTGNLKLPATPLAAGLLLFGTLQLGSDTVPLTLPVGGSSTPPPAALPATTATTTSTTPVLAAAPAAPAAAGGSRTTKWVSVQRSFGVFTIARVGVQYDPDGGGTLFFLLDSSILMGPLTFTTQGLGLGSKLTEFDPAFHLDGLGLSYRQPPLEISGGFLAVPGEELAADVAYQYDGFAVVKAASFSLAAIGSYAQTTAGDPSLFVFAQLEAPLGGPPAFFVVGLMGGFGYNRTISLPAPDEVLGFPLLVLGSPPAPGETATAQDPTAILAILEGQAPITPGGTKKAWIAPQTGEMWLAVGVEFTSFELVRTKALLIAQFGQELAFALLGLATMSLPQGAGAGETYAYVELQLEAVLKPSEGVFGLTAILGPSSYVIDPSCHLTGGFAFFVWFGSNPNAGQFVVTLGGYHPAFTPPPAFPTVPRLGFSWSVSDDVTVKGDAYFALTASCVMAGGGLEVMFQSGDLKAWFTAHMDVLISWHPFFFLADIGVSMGVSYQLDLLFVSKTISLSVGADLSLWGPPTGGTVTVHLWCISFTVDIGASQGSTGDTPLSPADFAALLPPAPTLVTAVAVDGLTSTLAPPGPPVAGAPPPRWMIRPSRFSFSTGSAIPATTVAYGGPGGADTTVATGFTLDVRPMDVSDTTATHTVRITRPDGTGGLDLTGWSPTIDTRPVPQSLWGPPLTTSDGTFTQLPQQAGADTVPGAPVGATFTCPAPVLGPAVGPVPEAAVAFEPVSAPGAAAVDGQSPWALGAVPDATGQPVADPDSLALVEQVATVAARTPILTALAAAQALDSPLYAGPTSDLAGLAAMANTSFAAAPMVVGAP